MEINDVKFFLDSCHAAKRITELMPKLPKGLTPRHIHVIDAIWQISQEYYDFYVDQYHNWLARQCSDIDPEHFRITAETLFHVFEILCMQKMEAPENE